MDCFFQIWVNNEILLSQNPRRQKPGNYQLRATSASADDSPVASIGPKACEKIGNPSVGLDQEEFLAK